MTMNEVLLATAARILTCGILACGILACGILACGILAVAMVAACGRSLPDSALAVVSSPAPTAIVECDVERLGGAGSGDDTTTVRFVAYGDVDRGDDVGCGMMPEARLAVIAGNDDIADWWELVGGKLGVVEQAPPGLLIPFNSENLSAAPALFVTTGSDGIAETSIADTGEIVTICAMFTINEGLIAGCSHERIRLKDGTDVYVYFSHNHAIVETGPEGAERYERFLNGADISDQPRVTVFLVSLFHGDYGPEPFFLSPDRRVAIIEDAYVDAWWSEVSDGEDVDLDMSGLGSGPYFDPEALKNEWVHVVTTGDTGVTKITLPSGDYLFCQVDGAGCDHANTAGSHDHVLEIDFSSGITGHGGVRMLTAEGEDSEGERLLIDATKAPVIQPQTTR